MKKLLILAALAAFTTTVEAKVPHCPVAACTPRPAPNPPPQPSGPWCCPINGEGCDQC